LIPENHGMFYGDQNLRKIKVNKTTVLAESLLPEVTKTKTFTGNWFNDNLSSDNAEYPENMVGIDNGLTSTFLGQRYSYPYVSKMGRSDTTYSWQAIGDVTLNTNLGDKVVKDVTGSVDSNIEINVPEIEGYTANLAKIKIHIDDEGNFTVQSTGKYDVNYTIPAKKPSGGSSHHSGSDKNTNSVEQLNQTVMAYHNQDNIKLYTMDGQEITNRELYPGSDWFSDEVVTRDNVKYYRVATNELVKAQDALVYVDHAATIVTKNGSPKSLSNEHSQSVSDRMLMSDTAWKTDRYAFFNGTKFYRVATNEWVNAEDVQDNL